jgi:hypothetical protein
MAKKSTGAVQKKSCSTSASKPSMKIPKVATKAPATKSTMQKKTVVAPTMPVYNYSEASYDSIMSRASKYANDVALNDDSDGDDSSTKTQYDARILHLKETNKTIAGNNYKEFTVYTWSPSYRHRDTRNFDTTWKCLEDANLRAKYVFSIETEVNAYSGVRTNVDRFGMKTFINEGDGWSSIAGVMTDQVFDYLRRESEIWGR